MSLLVTLPHFSKNIPNSPSHATQFPADQFPLCLSITFTRHAEDFADHLKSILDDIPKDEVRYRCSTNITTTFNCYCHSLESIRPVINDALGDTKMYIRYTMSKDKRIYPDDLWREGELVLDR